ncbi:MAG: di-heme oxidoredictase family protein [Gemmatimonadaceae bacterium]
MTRHAFALALLTTVSLGCADQPDSPVGPSRSLAPDAATDVLNSAQLEVASLGRAFLGGATTVFDSLPTAFGHPNANLDAVSMLLHDAGDEAFDSTFTPPTGIGPLFHNTSCASCHVGDGRGRPPILPGEQLETMLFRASIPGTNPVGGPNPAPGFGDQFQPRAIPGFSPEGDIAFNYVENPGQYADGSAYSLRVPTYTVINPWTAIPPGFMLSPRVAPPVFGLGLLEAIPASLLTLLADPSDRNHDGISGRLNLVYDVATGRRVIGRFGLKSNTPNLTQQAAGAYNGDMGVTTNLLPHESCEGQFPAPECGPHAAEVDDSTLNAVAFYTRTLGVPARRALRDPIANRGERVFTVIGCGSCHTPIISTGIVPGIPSVSAQIIRPFTDLLLHDMGPGLSDNRPDFLASGQEWRTPPLWGIGLINTVNGHTLFLHDGRARNLEEAILWHDGEGFGAREAFRKLVAGDRAALVKFLNSL